jgi:hypothetical protein
MLPGNEGNMHKFHISFFKKILSSDGHPFKCLQKSVDVRATGADSAIEKAKRSLEQAGRSWRDCADTLEVEEQL